jgi:hypothetical protein
MDLLERLRPRWQTQGQGVSLLHEALFALLHSSHGSHRLAITLWDWSQALTSGIALRAIYPGHIPAESLPYPRYTLYFSWSRPAQTRSALLPTPDDQPDWNDSTSMLQAGTDHVRRAALLCYVTKTRMHSLRCPAKPPVSSLGTQGLYKTVAMDIGILWVDFFSP